MGKVPLRQIHGGYWRQSLPYAWRSGMLKGGFSKVIAKCRTSSLWFVEDLCFSENVCTSDLNGGIVLIFRNIPVKEISLYMPKRRYKDLREVSVTSLIACER